MTTLAATTSAGTATSRSSQDQFPFRQQQASPDIFHRTQSDTVDLLSSASNSIASDGNNTSSTRSAPAEIGREPRGSNRAVKMKGCRNVLAGVDPSWRAGLESSSSDDSDDDDDDDDDSDDDQQLLQRSAPRMVQSERVGRVQRRIHGMDDDDTMGGAPSSPPPRAARATSSSYAEATSTGMGNTPILPLPEEPTETVMSGLGSGRRTEPPMPTTDSGLLVPHSTTDDDAPMESYSTIGNSDTNVYSDNIEVMPTTTPSPSNIVVATDTPHDQQNDAKVQEAEIQHVMGMIHDILPTATEPKIRQYIAEEGPSVNRVMERLLLDPTVDSGVAPTQPEEEKEEEERKKKEARSSNMPRPTVPGAVGVSPRQQTEAVDEIVTIFPHANRTELLQWMNNGVSALDILSRLATPEEEQELHNCHNNSRKSSKRRSSRIKRRSVLSNNNNNNNKASPRSTSIAMNATNYARNENDDSSSSSDDSDSDSSDSDSDSDSSGSDSSSDSDTQSSRNNDDHRSSGRQPTGRPNGTLLSPSAPPSGHSRPPQTPVRSRGSMVQHVKQAFPRTNSIQASKLLR